MRNVSSHGSYNTHNMTKLGTTILSGSQLMRDKNGTPTDNSTKYFASKTAVGSTT
jgi:hypothetical protein